jgi:hypothetical protein
MNIGILSFTGLDISRKCHLSRQMAGDSSLEGSDMLTTLQIDDAAKNAANDAGLVCSVPDHRCIPSNQPRQSNTARRWLQRPRWIEVDLLPKRDLPKRSIYSCKVVIKENERQRGINYPANTT